MLFCLLSGITTACFALTHNIVSCFVLRYICCCFCVKVSLLFVVFVLGYICCCLCVKISLLFVVIVLKYIYIQVLLRDFALSMIFWLFLLWRGVFLVVRMCVQTFSHVKHKHTGGNWEQL